MAPQLPVWNALLGAYGRAGSVDAAYEAWTRMLDSGGAGRAGSAMCCPAACSTCNSKSLTSLLDPQANPDHTHSYTPPPPAHPPTLLPSLLAAGATPDDLTERALALAFASHPALAADVVAEARQIRQSRQAAADVGRALAEAEPGGNGEEGEEGGEGEGAESDAEAGAAVAATAAAGAKGMRAPYRLQRHRQGSLPIDQPSSAQRSHTPLAQLLEVVRGRGSGSNGASAADAEQRGLQVRQLLLLDLHGSSVAAARMVLLRRLETLVLQVPELEAEVGRMEAEWRRQRAQRVQQGQRQAEQQALRHQQQDVAHELIAALSSGSSSRERPSSTGGGSGVGRRRQRGGEHAVQAAAEHASPQHAAPEQAAAQALHAAERWPELGRAWEAPAGPAGSAHLDDTGAAAGTGPGGLGDAQPPAPADAPPGRQAQFLPPSLCIITGVGRHSRGSGVLKGAVLELLQQQGLPTVEDPANEGEPDELAEGFEPAWVSWQRVRWQRGPGLDWARGATLALQQDAVPAHRRGSTQPMHRSVVCQCSRDSHDFAEAGAGCSAVSCHGFPARRRGLCPLGAPPQLPAAAAAGHAHRPLPLGRWGARAARVGFASPTNRVSQPWACAAPRTWPPAPPCQGGSAASRRRWP